MGIRHQTVLKCFGLTLKAPAKNAFENVVCCICFLTKMANLNVEANSVDRYWTAPTGAHWSECTLFDQEASKIFYQMTEAEDFVVVFTA